MFYAYFCNYKQSIKPEIKTEIFLRYNIKIIMPIFIIVWPITTVIYITKGFLTLVLAATVYLRPFSVSLLHWYPEQSSMEKVTTKT